MNWHPWQWVLAVAGAMLVGVAKTGVSGVGPLFVAVFASILPAKQATGLVLPLMLCGDVVATASYRAHARWRYLWRLFPSTAAGVVLGFFALGRVNNRQAQILVGAIVLALVALYAARRLRPGWEQAAHGLGFAVAIGVLVGFTTLVANAAGPLMILYLLAIGLPKMEFMGTGAVFFFLLNCYKVPFLVRLGLVNSGSLSLDLLLVPAVLLGAWLGKLILAKMNQRVFESLALGLSAVAGIKLLFL